jgi:hypothetical protein
MPASAPAAPQPSQAGMTWGSTSGSHPQSWSASAAGSGGAQPGTGGGSMWPGWASAGSDMSGADAQQAHTQHSKTHHFSPHGMPSLHGSAAGLHAAHSSLLSGNSGNSTITGGNTDLTNGHHHHHHHHHSQSLDTGS